MNINVSQSKEKSESLRADNFHRIYLYVSQHQNELEDSNLSGWIQVPNMYLNEHEFFRINYSDLDIDNTGEYYITFEDKECQKMAAHIWGDEVGLTQSRATLFSGKDITRSDTLPYVDKVSLFNELKYFTNLTQLPKQSFYAFSNLQSIECPPSLTTLGDDAFRDCTMLSEFGHLENLKTIGNSALRNTALSEIECNKIGSISENAFRYCRGLISAHIDGTFTTLPSFTFRECSNLMQVTGLSHVTTYQNEVFHSCTELTYVENIDKVTSMGNSCFYNCSTIDTLDTQNLLTIGNNTFRGCTSLQYLDTSKLISADYEAFRDTTSLEELDLSNLERIGNNAFAYSGITSLSFPKLTTSISSLGSFIRNCRNLETVEFNEDLQPETYTIASNFATEAINLKTINIGRCASIGVDAFKNCYELISIGEQPEEPVLKTLSTSSFNSCYKLDHIDISAVTTIPNSVFQSCRKLKNLGNNNVLNNTEYIREGAFRYCGTEGEVGLGEISFPNCTLVEAYAFYSTRGITKINFGNLQEIKSCAFEGCYDVEYITGLDNVTICRGGAFRNCRKLKDISLANVVEFADGSEHFLNCYDLNNVNLPKLTKLTSRIFKSVTINGLLNLPLVTDVYNSESFLSSRIRKINLHNCPQLYQYQFDGNTYLEEIDLTSCTTLLGRNTFNGCIALKNIELPSITGEIPYYTFRNCSELETVTFGENPIRLTQESMSNNPKLKTVNLNHATYIGDYALSGCPKLESIGSFSNELTYIGREVFENSKLTGNITIPASVQTIGYRAFYNCGSITSITMEATTPPNMNGESFNGALSYPIYVPATSVDAYKTAWRNIASRIFAAP